MNSISLLLSKYGKNILGYRKLNFEGVNDKDVYNVTAPFNCNGKQYIAGRVEKRDSEISETVFFIHDNGKFLKDNSAPALGLQDPFFSEIDKKILLGGVFYNNVYFKTEFYLGEDIFSLKKISQGPIGMKDIRLIQLNDGRIGVFTRPQGKIGGLGRIGFTILDSLQDFIRLTDDEYFKIPLIDIDLHENEWIGANALYHVGDSIGVLAHIACFSGADKNYYPVSFLFDPNTRKTSDMKIIVTRSDLPEGESKRDNLKNVMFGGGLVKQENGTVKLYAGVSDAEAYEIIIDDPFISYERPMVMRS